MSLLADEYLKTWNDTAYKDATELEQKKGVPMVAYFLLGAQSGEDIQVAHITKCPMPDTVDGDGDPSTKKIDEEWIVDNAEKVLRMLSGGIFIVGVAVICTKKMFSEERNMLVKVLSRTQRMAAAMCTFEMESLSGRMALLHIDRESKKASAIVTDVVKRGPDSPSKFEISKLNWVSIVCRVAVDMRTAVEAHSKEDFYKEFQAAIRPWITSLWTPDAVYAFDGELKEDSDLLNKPNEKKPKSSYEVHVYIACAGSSGSEGVVALPQESKKQGEVFEISFDLAVRASVPAKATFGDAKRALRQQLIRTLMARAALHYESMELQEDGRKIGNAIHQLPSKRVNFSVPINKLSASIRNYDDYTVHQLLRACTTVIPCAGSVMAYDYLFEGDTTDDAIKNFQILLSLKTSSPEEVDDLWERNLNEGEVEEPTAIISHLHRTPEGSSLTWLWILLSIIAVIIAIIVFAVIKAS